MAQKSVLIALHGMGTHDEKSLKKEIADASNTALRRYPGYETHSFEDNVTVVPIEYNSIFETVRQKIAEANKPVSQYLKGYDQKLSPHFLTDIANAEEGLGEDSTFNTHWLDVILYMTSVGEAVRNKVALELLKAMQNAVQDGQIIHVLGHSLGTAVLHDVLWKLYTSGVKDENGQTQKLSPVTHKLRSIWMFANVSLLVSRFSSISPHPLKTIVRPGPGNTGCTERFFNIHHKYDPFTIPYPFKVAQDDGWVSPNIWQDDYADVLTEKITRTDTHSLAGCIEDPAVTYRFLHQIMPLGSGEFSPDVKAWQTGNANIKTLVGKESMLKAFKNSAGSVKNLADFIQMGDAFQKATMKNA